MGTLLGYWRLVLLVREGLEVNLLEEFMEDDISAIWVRVGRKGKCPTHVGGIYHEHKFIWQDQPNSSKEPEQQNKKWDRCVKIWGGEASVNYKYIVLGDMNLDYKKWEAPEHHHVNMVEQTIVHH